MTYPVLKVPLNPNQPTNQRDVTDVCSASDGKQLNIGIRHRNFSPEYRNIGHRSFYPNGPFSMRKPLKFSGVPQTRQQISAISRPKFTILSGHVEEVLLFNGFFPIVDTCLSSEHIARQRCAMVPKWRFLRPVFPASRVQHISDLHSKFAHHSSMMQRFPWRLLLANKHVSFLSEESYTEIV